MRTTTYTIFVATLAIVATTASPTSAQSISAAPVAVLHFDVSAGADEGSKWADLLTAKISQQTPVVEREKLREILAEQQLTASGFTSPATAVKLGKLCGAKTLLAAGMYEIGDRHVVALRAVDAETGRALGKTLSAPIRDGQSAVIDRIAETVLESLPAWQQAELPAAVPTRPQLDLSIPAVAVLYFDPTGPVNAGWSWLSTALGDLTINLLASQNTRVISRDNMQTMLRELTLKDPNRDVRRTLEFVKAQRAVHGVYQVSDGRVQIRATLVEAATGNPLHVATVEGPVADVFALHRRATAEILDVLEGRRAGTLDPARLPVWNDDLDAGRTLYRGVESFDQGRYLDAWLSFRRAQQLAPNYPDAVYWAGRMMYYVQEYHQARHELLRFLVGWNDHPRAGDAGLELIHCSQSVGSSEAEVLETFALVAALAPQAEVANFERKGEPTFLAYYADALTAQLHISRRRLRAAAEALGRHLDVVTRDTDLYSHAWSRMYDLRTRHFNETGEWFELPAPPIYTDERWVKRSPGGKHPLNEARPEIDLTTSEPGDTADVRAERPLERLTLAEPSRSYDFRDDPLMIGAGTLGSGRYERHQSIMATFLHYFVAPPGHYLQSLTIDIDGEKIDSGYEYIMLHREGGGSLSLAGPAVTRSTTVQQPVADPNRFHYELGLPPHTRIVGIAPKLQKRSWRDPSTPHGRVVGWRVSAKFTPIPAEPTAALIVRQAADSPVKLLASMPPYSAVLSGFSPQFQPGEYPVRGLLTNVFMPSPFPPSYAAQVMKVEPGTATEVELDFRGTLIHNVNRVHHYYDGSTDLQRFTDSHRAGMGRSGDGRTFEFAAASFCVDRNGRLIAIWSVQRDLYLTISTDGGRTWGPCRLLSLPVNSAHIERNPCLYHGDDGRYVLAFNSDRGADRNMALYACWSTDLEEFSAPARISDQGGYAHRIFQRADGTYLL